MDIDACIREGFLKRVKTDKAMIEKELKSSKYDLDRAKASLQNGDFKWSTIQAYYAIFHASRALLCSLGYREKRHFAIGVVLESFAENKSIGSSLATDFNAAMSSREDADYRDVYSKDTAEYLVKIANEFLTSIKNLVKEK